MTSIGNFQAIAPNPAQAAGYSLLIAAELDTDPNVPADPPEQTEPQRWEHGLTWAPENLGGGGALAIDCHGRTPDGLALPNPPNEAVETAEPFVVYAWDQCSTFGFEARDYVGRATRQLLATQSARIAHELQLGTIRDAKSLENIALKDALTITAGTDFLESFARLEQAINETLAGRRAMIHVTPEAMSYAKSFHLVEQQGQKWITANGTIVAADGGYSAEGGDTDFMYATSMVRVLLGEVMVIPGTGEDAMRDATLRSTNLVTFFAERLALVTFDYGGTIDTPTAMFKIDSGITPWAD